MLSEAHAHGHAHPHGEVPKERGLPAVAWGVVAAVGLVVALAWAATWLSADDYMALLTAQLAGAAPVGIATFLALSGTMMVAMMLPSAMPMLRTYAGLAARDAGPAEARLRTGLFTLSYFVVWTVFTAGSLLALAAFGLLAHAGGAAAAYGPGALLVAAGAYQLTGWKAFCLRHCRSPLGFVMTHWRGGRAGALRMGVEHGAYCLGCCWLLMLVLFTAGAMSVLWMGVFAGLILGEKVWSRGEALTRAMGFVAIAAGLLSLGLALAGWAPVPPMDGAGGMAMP